MVPLNLKSLIGKLNDISRQTLEAAAGLCLSRTNYNVEIEHWLLKLLEVPNTDLAALLRYFEIDASRLTRDLMQSLDRQKTGNARPPALSPQLVDLSRAAWMLASVEFNAPLTRSGHVLAALLSDDILANVARDASREFEKVSPEQLRRELRDITAKTVEAEAETAAIAAAGPSGAPKPTGPVKTQALDQFTIDLTARARAGKIDPVLGRDAEVRQVIDILTRRRQNNPIMTGEAGVGKTAVVEGFAQRIADGDVPPALENVALRTLDLGLLQAGAGIKGEFENRLKAVIDEVKASPKPIILFIDEAHTMIGAGGQAGQGDAANLLKPALARGELRTIAATTWAEYKKYFERDAALARRFQVVKVEEPEEKKAIEMMRGLVDTLEGHHGVRILDEAVVDSVRLSQRYISGRQLPDKSVSLLDTASARVAISHSAIPAQIEDCRRRIEQLRVAIDILEREQVTGGGHEDKLAEYAKDKQAAEAELAALDERFKKEKELVMLLRGIRDQLEGDATARRAAARMKAVGNGKGDEGKPAETPPTAAKEPVKAGTAAPIAVALADADREKLRKELDEKTAVLKELQGEHPLMQVCVDAQAVAEVVSNWTGIPVGRMVADEINTVLSLKQLMAERIVGQDHALDAIAQRIRTSRANLTDPRRPIGVFLLVGTSGTGKTETAMTLAELLYGGDQNMTVINMSEFKEEHKVSLLMGSPPGYVGYGEGGVLTEAVRRRPYSVVLLDEMEKAHPGVQDVFYQVFDKGRLRDGEGRDIDFRNTVIIMTSNAATDLVMKLCADADTRPEPEAFGAALHDELTKTFKPAFLGRVAVVPYYPLTDEVMRGICKLQLGRIGKRIAENYKASFSYTDDVVASIVSRCTEVDTGARNVDHILTRTMLPEMSAEFLARMAEGEKIRKVDVGVTPEGTFTYSLE
ncbi:MAG: type VI secretion system ATPase TssH [Planctomycetota bacterium]|nr:MAG: type VI secretion system ATPase TssH [Planctomycetota bacterium]